MVGLYKDPKGESVFSDFRTNDAGIAGSVQLNRGTAFGTEETLRKKIIELESALCTYQVIQSLLYSYSIVSITMIIIQLAACHTTIGSLFLQNCVATERNCNLGKGAN